MASFRVWARIHSVPLVLGIAGLALGAISLFILLGAPVNRILSTIGASVPSGPGVGGSGSGSDSDGESNPAQPDTAGAVVLIDAARPDLLIIKTGTLELQVRSVDAAVEAAAAAIGNEGGYVSGSEQSGDGEGASAEVTYRIPSERWDAAHSELRALALKVVSEQTHTDDVSAEVVDLSARIANLQATERAFQAIMTKASVIDDVLDVQDELTTVRGQIEEATAERAHLMQQASFSTLTVRFGLRPEPAVAVSQARFDPASEVDRASATLVDIGQRLATAGIWFGIVWLPILIVLGLIAIIVAWGYRRLTGANGGAPDAPPG
jgi:hypothetical protein